MEKQSSPLYLHSTLISVDFYSEETEKVSGQVQIKVLLLRWSRRSIQPAAWFLTLGNLLRYGRKNGICYFFLEMKLNFLMESGVYMLRVLKLVTNLQNGIIQLPIAKRHNKMGENKHTIQLMKLWKDKCFVKSLKKTDSQDKLLLLHTWFENGRFAYQKHFCLPMLNLWQALQT